MSDYSSHMEQAHTYPSASSSSNPPPSLTPTPTTKKEVGADGDSVDDDEEQVDDDGEEDRVLIPGCRRGRSGTLIRGVRSDSPVPFSDNDDPDADFELITKGSRDQSTATTSRLPSSTKEYGVSDQKAQLRPLGPLEHDYDITRDDRSTRGLLARKRVSRSSSYGLDMRGAPAAGLSGFPKFDIEHKYAAKRVEEPEGERAELPGLVLHLAKMNVEEKK